MPRTSSKKSVGIKNDITPSDQILTLSKKWNKQTTRKSKAKLKYEEKVVIEIFNYIKIDDSKISNELLSQLEGLEYLEKYLWPFFHEDVTKEHIYSIVLIFLTKSNDEVPIWDLLITEEDNNKFSLFFTRCLSLITSPSSITTIFEKTFLLSFISLIFQNIDIPILRKECASLVSISIWNCLKYNSIRDDIISKNQMLKRMWKNSNKKFDSSIEDKKNLLIFLREWFYRLLLSFMNDISLKNQDKEKEQQLISYGEKLIELIIDIISQLPTRRFTNTLIKHLNFITILKLSNIYKNPLNSNFIFKELITLLEYYIYYPVNDFTGLLLTNDEIRLNYSVKLLNLQKLSFTKEIYKKKLTILSLSNFKSLENKESLLDILKNLNDDELKQLCEDLKILHTYNENNNNNNEEKGLKTTRNIIELIFMDYFFNDNKTISINNWLPNETDCFSKSLEVANNYHPGQSLPLPKLGLQYLTVNDFFVRYFKLYRSEINFQIRSDIEDVIKRLKPHKIIDDDSEYTDSDEEVDSKDEKENDDIKFSGYSKMALKINSTSILEIGAPKITETVPSLIRCEIQVDVGRLPNDIKKEWDSLRNDEVVFLLSVTEPNPNSLNLNERIGVNYLRCGQVIQVLDGYGKSIYDDDNSNENGKSKDGYRNRGRSRRFHVKLDNHLFEKDNELSLYKSFNVIMRRKGKENNFKPILDTIHSLITETTESTSTILPNWINDIFLGFGNPLQASFDKMNNRNFKVNFFDTFISSDHLIESFPDYDINFENEEKKEEEEVVKKRKTRKGSKKIIKKSTPPPPPYIVDFTNEETKKLTISTYEPTKLIINKDPFLNSGSKIQKNHLRFTPTQIQAIHSGISNGLTIIVGPPGTGKSDVATQIINNIFHNNPREKTLVITHSNHALNHLFEKIVKLDIDERFLLRLGYNNGEEFNTHNTNTNNDIEAPYGRIERFLEIREYYLQQVTKLSKSLNIIGDHGDSCETSLYFYKVYILPLWNKFKNNFKIFKTIDEIKENFPFNEFFKINDNDNDNDTENENKNKKELFSNCDNNENCKQIAIDCFYYIKRIFSNLETTRPFELLKSNKKRSEYLLVTQAKIIAMTATHAAIHRQDIINSGFKYDNIIIEEAAQLTELETLLALTLGTNDSGSNVKRIIMIGDHHQNAPIIKNIGFKKFSNLDQSLFGRFIRLGVPVFQLDAQGRSRPDIYSIFSHIYISDSTEKQEIKSLPHVLDSSEYQLANAGFAKEYQFINVDDYQGHGESEPSSHFYQNLGEAEYSVAIYSYMRLLGYPNNKITILAMYQGQKVLIEKILSTHCGVSKLALDTEKDGKFQFGWPVIDTVDNYQGQQNDYIILSLVRTKRLGYIRDIRRLTVALSRARLGLYVLGRKEIYDSFPDPNFSEMIDKLLNNDNDGEHQLQLAIGEMYGNSTRKVTDEELPEGVQFFPIENVEHLRQYVQTMTQMRMKADEGENKGEENKGEENKEEENKEEENKGE